MAIDDPVGIEVQQAKTEIDSESYLPAANAEGKTTPTQDLGTACYLTEQISALKVPSAAHSDGTSSSGASPLLWVSGTSHVKASIGWASS